MNNTEKANQLRLAADIIEKNLPWEMSSNGQGWFLPVKWTLLDTIKNGYQIRIKPFTLGRSINGFTLGEGQEWHRQDWTADMLPEGWRPLLADEIPGHAMDEVSYDHGTFRKEPKPLSSKAREYIHRHFRTRRPLPVVIPDGFTPWDGGECPTRSKVDVILRNGELCTALGDEFWWGHDKLSFEIIAYRVTEPKLVPWSCGDDVPINCWLRHKHESQKHFAMLVVTIQMEGVVVSTGELKTWAGLKEYLWSANRKTWNPCTKEIH